MTGGDGPACGSLGASTFLMVVYSDDGGIHFAEDWYCCHRHVPHPADLLSEGAKVIEVVIADARYTTVAMDDWATVTDGMTFDSRGPRGRQAQLEARMSPGKARRPRRGPGDHMAGGKMLMHAAPERHRRAPVVQSTVQVGVFASRGLGAGPKAVTGTGSP